MKVYASIMCASRETDTSPTVFQLSYMLMSGAKRSDHVLLTPTNYSSESFLLLRLKQALILHLNVKYTPETFSTSDIALFGG